jgi:mono/diheme cytochrome c family protein
MIRRAGPGAAAGRRRLRARGAQPDAQGAALAEARCAACHAVGRSGASPRANAPARRDLHRRHPVGALAEALAEGIVTGRPDMPGLPFSAAEVEARIARLRNLKH